MKPKPRAYVVAKATVKAAEVEPKNLLDELHEQYLKSPPTAKEGAASVKAFLKALEARKKVDSEGRKLNDERLKLVAMRRAIATSNKRIHHLVMKNSAEKAERQAELDDKARAVLLAHGRVPVQLGDVVYDFGCTAKRVYLVPRVAPKSAVQRTKGKKS